MQNEQVEIRIDYNTLIKSLGIVMVFLLVIAVVSVGLILSPAVIHKKGVDEEIILTPAATTFEGLQLRVDAWKEYPEYNIGLGALAALSFSGAIYVCAVMYSLRELKNDALQSKFSGEK